MINHKKNFYRAVISVIQEIGNGNITCHQDFLTLYGRNLTNALLSILHDKQYIQFNIYDEVHLTEKGKKVLDRLPNNVYKDDCVSDFQKDVFMKLVNMHDDIKKTHSVVFGLNSAFNACIMILVFGLLLGTFIK